MQKIDVFRTADKKSFQLANGGIFGFQTDTKTIKLYFSRWFNRKFSTRQLKFILCYMHKVTLRG